jgi:hypothetical protein
MRERIQVNVQTGERSVVPYTDEENRLADEEKAKQDAYEAEFGYIDKRKAEYPPMEDYLDGIVKGDNAQVKKYIDACSAVKKKYPK